jgi:hypothetical protein
VTFPRQADDEDAAFALLRATVERLAATKAGPPHLSSLKSQLRKTQPEFTEKRFGYSGFLQFAKAAHTRGLVDLRFDESADDYVVSPAER